MPRLALLTAVGGPIELAEFPLSTPAPGTAASKLRMAGICGSDLHIFRDELPLPPAMSTWATPWLFRAPAGSASTPPPLRVPQVLRR